MPDDNQTNDDASDAAQTITESAREQLSSRRGFVAGTLAVGGAGLLGTAGSTLAASSGSETETQQMGGDGSNGDSSGSGGSSSDGPSDVDILNYALTLEHLEHQFYHMAQEDFSDEDLMTADVVCNRLCPETREMIPEYIGTVTEHEHTHVDQLTKVINDLGGDPVAAGEYDFGYDTPSGFLKVASTLENTGVAAYAGAAPSLQNDDLLSAALSIHSVEARHAGLINFFIGESAFPNAFDEAKSMETVKDAISGFIVSG